MAASDDILRSIDVEIEILLADRIVGAVFANLLDRGIELFAQIVIALAQRHGDFRFGTRNVAKELAAIRALLLQPVGGEKLIGCNRIDAAAFQIGVSFVGGRIELHVSASLAVNVIGIIALRGASLRTHSLAVEC